MLSKISIVVLLLIPYISLESSTPQSGGTLDINKVQLEKDDLPFGKNLLSLFSSLKKGRVSRKVTKKLIKLQTKTALFSDLRPLIRKARQISLLKNNLKSFHKRCKIPKGKKTQFNSPIYLHLNKALEKYCRQDFIKLLISKRSRFINLKKTSLNYFEYALPYYLKSNSKKSLLTYLNKNKKFKRSFDKLSEKISTVYINHNIEPGQDVIDNIFVSEEFSEYLGKKGFQTSMMNNSIQREFKLLLRSVSNSLRRKNEKSAVDLVDEALEFYSQNKHIIDKNVAWKSFFSFGRRLFYTDEPDKAFTLLNFSRKLANGAQQQSKSLFRMLWVHLFNKDISRALSVIKDFNLIGRFSQLDHRLQFWVAYTLKLSGERHLSKHFYTQLAKQSPLNFYSIISLQEIYQIDPELAEKTYKKRVAPSPAMGPLSKNDFSPSYFKSLKQILVWINLDAPFFVNMEIKDLLSLKKNKLLLPVSTKGSIAPAGIKRHIIFHIANLLQSRKRFLDAFQLLYYSLGQNLIQPDHNVLKLLFPLPYIVPVKKISRDIDPILVLSLMRQESAFNPRAISRVGARGLMQIMPRTARDVVKNISISKLYNPNINMRIGIKILERLIDRYNGNLIFVLAAYNAGEGKLKRWLQTILSNDNPLMIIESIPYEETRQYIKLIYRNIFFYNMLLGRARIDIPVNNAFDVFATEK